MHLGSIVHFQKQNSNYLFLHLEKKDEKKALLLCSKNKYTDPRHRKQIYVPLEFIG
jgi:hypothetical protein